MRLFFSWAPIQHPLSTATKVWYQTKSARGQLRTPLFGYNGSYGSYGSVIIYSSLGARSSHVSRRFLEQCSYLHQHPPSFREFLMATRAHGGMVERSSFLTPHILEIPSGSSTTTIPPPKLTTNDNDDGSTLRIGLLTKTKHKNTTNTDTTHHGRRSCTGLFASDKFVDDVIHVCLDFFFRLSN